MSGNHETIYQIVYQIVCSNFAHWNHDEPPTFDDLTPCDKRRLLLAAINDKEAYPHLDEFIVESKGFGGLINGLIDIAESQPNEALDTQRFYKLGKQLFENSFDCIKTEVNRELYYAMAEHREEQELYRPNCFRMMSDIEHLEYEFFRSR